MTARVEARFWGLQWRWPAIREPATGAGEHFPTTSMDLQHE
jgi:hypothetical protein